MQEISKPLISEDPNMDVLKQLLQEVSEIRRSVFDNANIRLEKYAPFYRSGVFTKSAINLAQYLALRQFDLRHLQQRLAHVGLSSLGRAESSVLSTLDAVLDLLKRATHAHDAAISKDPSEYGFHRGQQLLEQHTIELFGPFFEKSKAHIMVTLATDCAWDYRLIHALLSKGMTCARINCAHDNPAAWLAMIRNVRRAEAETGRSCRVMMDLAGHKIRTGAIELGPAVYHIKIKRDAFGNCITPGRILLCSEQATVKSALEHESGLFQITLPDHFFAKLSIGSELAFQDARNKPRMLIVEKAVSEHVLQARCEQNSYLVSESELQLLNQDLSLDTCKIGPFAGAPKQIVLFQDDLLLLTENDIPGKPAVYDEQGVVVTPAQIGCTLDAAIKRLKVGDPVWFDDGKLGAKVEKITNKGAFLRVIRARNNGVDIMSDKGINFPETDLALPSLSEKDLEDLDFACAHADLIGFSFVESLDDMECLINELAKRSATDIPIIAKIETNRAVKNLPEIILGAIGRHSLGIMIARGDLAVELGSARLAEIQEELLWLCEAAHVPVIWATQVLESIAKKGAKSRPEFTDAAMAVRAECVMLNKGPYITDALEALVNVMVRMHEHQRKKFPKLRALQW